MFFDHEAATSLAVILSTIILHLMFDIFCYLQILLKLNSTDKIRNEIIEFDSREIKMKAIIQNAIFYCFMFESYP